MEPEEKRGSKQAAWRTNPAESGIGGAIGDIGTHAFNLAEYACRSLLRTVGTPRRQIVP